MTAPAWQLVVALAVAADPRAQLEALKARKAAEQAAAQVLERREGSVLSAVDAAERSCADAEAALRVVDRDRASAEEQLERARAEEDVAAAQLASVEQDLRPRLRARARLAGVSELRLLAASSSLADMVQRRHLWDAVTHYDLRLFRAAQRALIRQREARAAIERESSTLDALARDAELRRDVAAARRADHRNLLLAIRSARSLHERAAAEAAAQEGRLAEFVAALPPPVPGSPLHTGFALLKGKLPLPVNGTVAVGFGPVVNPRFNTVTVQHGIDIRAPVGAEVRAVAPGRVAHAGWFRGYGNLVIVDHGDGYHTLVAHLGSMNTAMGEEVQAGTLLGTVGDTGALRGPYLYFEIREKGRPVDPRVWLRPW